MDRLAFQRGKATGGSFLIQARIVAPSRRPHRLRGSGPVGIVPALLARFGCVDVPSIVRCDNAPRAVVGLYGPHVDSQIDTPEPRQLSIA